MDRTSTAAIQARRRRRRRRQAVVVTGTVVLVSGGAGTALALHGPDGAQYRLATVTRSSVNQTVEADGALSAKQVVEAAFASAGTVAGVTVAVGDAVRGGQTLATMDPADLKAALTSAQKKLAQAKQTRADDEDAEANGTTVSASTSGTSSVRDSTSSSTTTSGTDSASTSQSSSTVGTDSESATELSASGVAAGASTSALGPSSGSSTPAGSSSSPAGSGATLTGLRKTVTHDAAAFVSALHKQTAAITSACTPAGETSHTEVSASPEPDGTISGTVGSQSAVITLQSGDNTVRTAGDGTPLEPAADYSFTGLTVGQSYTVDIQSVVIDAATCTAAITAATSDTGTLSAAQTTLDQDLVALGKAIAQVGTSAGVGSGSAGGTGATGSGPASGTSGGATSGSGSTGSRSRGSTAGTGSGRSTAGSGKAAGSGNATGSGSATGTSAGTSGRGTSRSGTASATGTGGTVVTAERIVADSAAITAAEADLAVARHAVTTASLTSPITGTVAAVALSAGDSVSASSSSATITVVGTGALSVDLTVAVDKIDQVKVGQIAHVTVDGRTAALPAKVTFVGQTNSSDTTGSTSAYPVTVQLDATASGLYDGMGASVSIDTGTVSNALTVPVSAVHTTGTRSIVDTFAHGKPTATSVTLGVVGGDRVQVTKGLSTGEQIVLAEISAAVPSTTDTTDTGRAGGSFAGLTGGTGGLGGGGGFGGGGAGGGFAGRTGGR